ncbi:MAG: hypothetical protein MI919_08015 [Holophagales bacterium]|nr:hypothetical protein [Holophagales bacterium]
MHSLFIVWFLFGVFAGTAFAETPSDSLSDDGPSGPQEVFLGELAFPQEQSELQITIANSVEDEETVLEASFEWGITDRLQIELELGGLIDSADTATGLGRVSGGGRYARGDARSGILWAAGAEVGWATRAVGETPRDALFFEPHLLLGRDVRGGHLFALIGTEWVLDDGDLGMGDEGPEDELELVLGGFATTAWGAWTLELGTERALSGGDDPEIRVAVGGVVRLGDRWELGLAGVVGVDGDAEEAWLTTLTYEP